MFAGQGENTRAWSRARALWCRKGDQEVRAVGEAWQGLLWGPGFFLSNLCMAGPGGNKEVHFGP